MLIRYCLSDPMYYDGLDFLGGIWVFIFLVFKVFLLRVTGLSLFNILATRDFRINIAVFLIVFDGGIETVPWQRLIAHLILLKVSLHLLYRCHY